MGEEKEKKAQKKEGGGGGKDGPVPIVLKMDLHCTGCCIKVKNAIKKMSGVKSVTTDLSSGKVTVMGSADATKLKERIEDKMHKPVSIVSAPNPPKKDADAGGGDKKADNGKEQKAAAVAEEKKPKEVGTPVESTAVMKIRLHCDGCMDRIKRRAFKVKGVKEVTFDAAKDLVTVRGTMDVPAMQSYLREKLNRGVEIVAPGKKDDGAKKEKGGDGEKKNDDKAGGEGKKKEKENAEKEKAAPEQVAVMQTTAMPMMPMMVDPARYNFQFPNYYAPYGHRIDMPHAPQMFSDAPQMFSDAPQMFSDENPNASCSIM